eukprot:superscaffoldBa00011060_g25026
MTTFSGNHQSAALDYLKRRQTANQKTGLYLLSRHLQVCESLTSEYESIQTGQLIVPGVHLKTHRDSTEFFYVYYLAE